MQTDRKGKKTSLGQARSRSLKIHTKMRINQYSTSFAPEIRLCGTWIARAGFNEEERVIVDVMNGMLIIRPEPLKTRYVQEGELSEV